MKKVKIIMNLKDNNILIIHNIKVVNKLTNYYTKFNMIDKDNGKISN